MTQQEKTRQKKEKLRLVRELLAQGLGSAEIAARLGVSRESANGVIRQAKAFIEDKDPIDELSFRASTFLRKLGLLTREQVMAAHRAGALEPKRDNRYENMYGSATYQEIVEWLGEPLRARVVRLSHCPHCHKPLSQLK